MRRKGYHQRRHVRKNRKGTKFKAGRKSQRNVGEIRRKLEKLEEARSAASPLVKRDGWYYPSQISVGAERRVKKISQQIEKLESELSKHGK